ncbi:rRNA methyltransferase [Viridibacillus sp. YIM B01967]|uniref:rRNA methyltransferase n=1 Tax=Viridibacillus soli TaxID=2798301 RepID=A0ABS1HBE8_9BACL|nr:rRNA methyltransferase [Viridibacillus soli]MBK3496308.1 rRNA methyltransferase [Viridibacillus soli]
MWKLTNGKLLQATDTARVKFRTNISATVLERLKEMADDYDTHVNYLLESGIQEVLKQNTIVYDKATRPIDRVQYKTTYDADLLKALKAFAKQQQVYINDVIEYSVQYIDLEDVKNASYKHRVE